MTPEQIYAIDFAVIILYGAMCMITGMWLAYRNLEDEENEEGWVDVP